MALKLWDFDSYSKWEKNRDEVARLISETPTSLNTLEQQLEVLKGQFEAFEKNLSLEESWSRTELSFRKTLLSKIDIMSMEPEMTQDMLNEIGSMADFITWNETKVDDLIETITARRKAQKILEMEDDY